MYRTNILRIHFFEFKGDNYITARALFTELLIPLLNFYSQSYRSNKASKTQIIK